MAQVKLRPWVPSQAPVSRITHRNHKGLRPTIPHQKSFTELQRGNDTFANRQKAKAICRVHLSTDDYTVSTAFLLETSHNSVTILTKKQNPKSFKSSWIVLKIDANRISEYRLLEL